MFLDSSSAMPFVFIGDEAFAEALWKKELGFHEKDL
jgi:hypothetical protein